jgi:hypothetical protein
VSAADPPLTPDVARAYATLTAAGAPAGPLTLAQARLKATEPTQGPPQRPTAAAVAALLRADVIDREEARELLGLPPRPAPLLTPTFRRAVGYRHPGTTMQQQAAWAAQAGQEPARRPRARRQSR